MGRGADTGARGTVLGLVTAAGAAWAHHAAGGTIPASALALALLASVAAGVVLTRPHRPSAGRVVLLAGATQLAWHLLFAADPAHAHAAGGHGSPGSMLLTHLAVAAVSAGLALGADRALLRLARAALDRLRVPAPGHPSYDVTSVPLAGPVGRAPRPPAAGTAPVRGPPRAPGAHTLALLAPATA